MGYDVRKFLVDRGIDVNRPAKIVLKHERNKQVTHVRVNGINIMSGGPRDWNNSTHGFYDIPEFRTAEYLAQIFISFYKLQKIKVLFRTVICE